MDIPTMEPIYSACIARPALSSFTAWTYLWHRSAKAMMRAIPLTAQISHTGARARRARTAAAPDPNPVSCPR